MRFQGGGGTGFETFFRNSKYLKRSSETLMRQHDTEIRYDCATRRFAVIIDGEVVALAWHYFDAEACRLGWLWLSAWLTGQHDEAGRLARQQQKFIRKG